MCFLVPLFSWNRKLQYLSVLLPLVVSASIETTRLEGMFASCIACIFGMKMHSFIECKTKVSLSKYNHYLWTPTLVYQPEKLVYKQERNTFYIIKCIINSSLIILWDLYFINYEIAPTLQFEDFQLFLTQYAFRLGILIVVNHYLIFDYLPGLFCEITKVTNLAFYEDWWNADGFSQLNRRWNFQVHLYLKINFYQKYSKNSHHIRGLIITYLVTALLHEYCIAVAMKTVRMYFLMFSCFQFVLIPYQKYIPFQKYILFLQILFGTSVLIYLYSKF